MGTIAAPKLSIKSLALSFEHPYYNSLTKLTDMENFLMEKYLRSKLVFSLLT